MPAADDDWRIQALEERHAYLHGQRLTWIAWSSDDPACDHDHCEFCWQKFGPFEDAVGAGWVTDDDEVWICAACANDFRDRFGWTLAPTQHEGGDRATLNPPVAPPPNPGPTT